MHIVKNRLKINGNQLIFSLNKRSLPCLQQFHSKELEQLTFHQFLFQNLHVNDIQQRISAYVVFSEANSGFTDGVYKKIL